MNNDPELSPANLVLNRNSIIQDIDIDIYIYIGNHPSLLFYRWDQIINIIQEDISSFLEFSYSFEYDGFISKIRNIASISQKLILMFPFRKPRCIREFYVDGVNHRSLLIWRYDININDYSRILVDSRWNNQEYINRMNLGIIKCTSYRL